MRRAFGFYDVIIALMVLAVALAVIDGITRITKLKNDGRVAFEARSQAASYLEKAKIDCAANGTGEWEEAVKLLGKYDRKVIYGCSSSGGDLHKVWAKVCDESSGHCTKELVGYVYIKVAP